MRARLFLSAWVLLITLFLGQAHASEVILYIVDDWSIAVDWSEVSSDEPYILTATDEEGHRIQALLPINIDHPQMIFDELPPGTYTFGVYPQQRPAEMTTAATRVLLEPCDDASGFTAITGVEVMLAIPGAPKDSVGMPTILLTNSSGKVVSACTMGHLVAHDLEPGAYTISFEPLDGYTTPAPISVILAQGEYLSPLLGNYLRARSSVPMDLAPGAIPEQSADLFSMTSLVNGRTENAAQVAGTVTVTYDTGARQERLKDVRFYLINSLGHRKVFPAGQEAQESDEGRARSVAIPGLRSGTYTMMFDLPNSDGLFSPTPPRTLWVEPGASLVVYQSLVPQYASLEVKLEVPEWHRESSELPQAILVNAQGQVVGRSSRGELIVDGLAPGDYQLHFMEIPGYRAPQSVYLVLEPTNNVLPHTGYIEKVKCFRADNYALSAGGANPPEDEALKLSNTAPHIFRYRLILTPAIERTPVTATVIEEPTTKDRRQLPAANALVLVPAGRALMGDPFGDGHADEHPVKTVKLSDFYLSAYPITNNQYALWLMQALQKGLVKEDKGCILDQKGDLLFLTQEAEPRSQIGLVWEAGQPVVRALPEKLDHPVVFVTWYGAQLYCRDQGGRLPTEAEWEMAAGISVETHGHTRKFRYGFGRNTINKSWANYLDKYREHPTHEVRTTAVGYFNGANLLFPSTTVTASALSKMNTHHAVSPNGLYDMSGNVREWVADWYSSTAWASCAEASPQGPSQGSEKVTKGGCYNSTAHELRVSARVPIAPGTASSEIGFRIAFDSN